jgi:hypothetical protein
MEPSMLHLGWMVAVVALLLAGEDRVAEAYIDPGNASYLFQLIAGALLGGLFLVRTYWNRMVSGIRSLFDRDATRVG